MRAQGSDRAFFKKKLTMRIQGANRDRFFERTLTMRVPGSDRALFIASFANTSANTTAGNDIEMIIDPVQSTPKEKENAREI